LLEAAKEADLLIAEATYGENEQAQLAIDHGHMNFAQAAAVASKSGVKQLWLVHYSQMIEDPEMYLPNASEIFPETYCGRDGMRTTLQFEN
jgi:ribonuclease Z